MKNKAVTIAIRIGFLIVFALLLAKGKMMIWLGIFIGSLLGALLFGRFYCGYVCPMNTLMIPTESISKQLKIQSDTSPRWLKNGYFQWIALLGSVMSMVILKKFLHINFPILIVWLIVSMLVTLKYKPAVFHNLICPYGGLLKASGRLSKKSKNVVEDICIGCKLCVDVCPADAISITGDKKAIIDSSKCHQCQNCAKICPTDAIKYI